MDRDPPSRRDFLASSRSAVGGAWLLRFAPLLTAAQACAADARRSGLPLTTLTDREGADFDAFAARIVPTDDTPGAREAGAVHFADRALETFFSEFLPVVRAGLERLGARAEASGGGRTFAELDEAQQDDLIAEVEQDDSDFFFYARALVVMSLVADPQYGGNRDGVGWDLIGFESLFAYQPPFGYYDRDEHGQVSGP